MFFNAKGSSISEGLKNENELIEQYIYDEVSMLDDETKKEMKKVLLVLAVAGFFAACGGATESATETATETPAVETEAVAETATETAAETPVAE